jgi:hypothetical protein
LGEDTFLGDELLRQLMSVGEVDILIGIPSYNNVDTIGPTVEAVEQSLQQNFVRDRVVIVNVDGGSTDHTKDVILQMQERKNPAGKGLSSLRTVHRLTSQYANTPSQGAAVRIIVAAADLLRARSCAIVSPATGELTGSRVANLLRPVHRDRFDFLAPLYARGKFHGLLVRNLLYPMSRAAFGRRIREIYSLEWAFSGRLASLCVDQNVWHQEAVLVRPEGWMASTAMCSDLKSSQSFLGPSVALPPGGTPDIVEAIRQTVGSLFWCLEANQDCWLNRKGSEPVPTYGPDHELTEETVPASQEKMFELFRNGVSELEPILGSILDPDTHARIKEIATLDQNAFRFGTNLWVKTIYEFAAAYHHSVINRDHLVQALVPLYRGHLYSFLLEHANSSADEMEAYSENLCLEFEREKSYLIERWKAKVEVHS